MAEKNAERNAPVTFVIQHCIYLLFVFFMVTLNVPVNAQPPLTESSADTVEQVSPELPATSPAYRPPTTNSKNIMSPSKMVGQVVGGLLLVTTLIFVLAWLAKRMGYANFNGGSHLNVVASLPLGGREKAILVNVDGQKILLGVAPGRVNFLQTIESVESNEQSVPEEGKPKQTVPIKKGQEFARYLKSMLDSGSRSNEL